MYMYMREKGDKATMPKVSGKLLYILGTEIIIETFTDKEHF